MLFLKPPTRLGFFGAFALAGLAGCAIWPCNRIPTGPHGAAPEVVSTPAPTTAEPTPGPQLPATQPPLDAAGSSTNSAPAPVTAPPAPPASESASGPAASPPSPSATSAGPPLAPPAAPEVAPGSFGPLPPEPAPADVDGNQLRPQRPLNISSPASNPADSNQSSSGQPSVGVTAQVQVVAPGSPGQPQQAGPQPEKPLSPLAKLKARFHRLVQPSPKPPQKPLNSDKSSEPVATPRDASPPAVAVRIPLSTTDELPVAKANSPTLHGLYSADEGPEPVATPSARESQPGIMRAAQSQSAGALPLDANPPPALPSEIEQWPNSPQAAVKLSNASKAALPANDFDPMPVEEYRAAVAKATGDVNSLPAFETAPGNSSAHVSQPVAATAPELRIVPKAEIAPTQSRPALIRIHPAEPQASTVPQAAVSEPPDFQDHRQSQQSMLPVPPAPASDESATPASSIEPASPAVTLSAVPPQTVEAPSQAVPAPTTLWIGGRYGQPAWMAVPTASAPNN